MQVQILVQRIGHGGAKAELQSEENLNPAGVVYFLKKIHLAIGIVIQMKISCRVRRGRIAERGIQIDMLGKADRREPGSNGCLDLIIHQSFGICGKRGVNVVIGTNGHGVSFMIDKIFLNYTGKRQIQRGKASKRGFPT